MPYKVSDFELLRKLGDGSYSQVILARHKSSGTEYALKVVDKHHVIRHKVVDQIRRERRLLASIEDDGIVKLYFTFQDPLSLYLGLEPCLNGELYEQIRSRGTLPIETVVQYSAEIVLMLEALEKYNIVHRDLKPENILLDSKGHLKLVDFGTAKELAVKKEDESSHKRRPELRRNSIEAGVPESTLPVKSQHDKDDDGLNERRAVSLVGTAEYVSPEVLENKEVTRASDLWALGCIIYQMIIGRTPFKGASEYVTFQNILGGTYEPLKMEGVATISGSASLGEAASDLVSRLLCHDPEERLGAHSIQDLKSHAFFSAINWECIRSKDAPEFERIEEDSIGSAGSSFDWELMSLAAALRDVDHTSDDDNDVLERVVY
jgi:3-phosphoinositide dependent protein kinase-1